MGSKNWAGGEVVTAADFNSFVADQVVMVFADATARDAGFGGTGEPTLAEGMVCYVSDTNEVQVYGGSAWATIADADVMVVDSGNSRVGIGTATPDNILHLHGTTGNHRLVFTNSNNTVGEQGMSIGFDTDRMAFQRTSDSGGWEANHMVIDQDDGKVGIGTNTPGYPLEVAGDVRIGGGGDVRISDSGAPTTTSQDTILYNDGQRLQVWNNGATRLILETSGSAYNTTGTWGTISDERLKDDIVTARSYTSDLLTLRVVNYSLTQQAFWDKETGVVGITPLEEPSEKLLGFIAQEVEKVFPAMVATGEDGFKSVKTSVLVPMMLTAIQELTARIEALEA
jgi:hypothetical protein